MATQNYEVTVNPNAITLDLTTQNNILTVQTVDYIMSLSRTGGQGAQGYSAYEIAVQNGYTGTAQEFSDELASIAEKSALAVASAAAAATSATSATNSATASAASASNSSISAGAASASANAAAQSAVTAAAQANASSQSATNSAASALESSNYADASEDSAIDSELSAADAAASEDAAASSEANALLYRNEAQTAATSAGASSTNANAQALAASLSAASAATSATNADNSEDNAASSATSALNSATSANTSANQAAISATTATTQATSATNSATAAAASQADALVSKNSASASASTATTKASEASNSAATASTKATEASASAAQAVLSATSASTSASTATLKAAEAAQSAADAAAAQAAAEASLASFRSTYLGELNADPTLDGNGDPVMIGAEYFNSAANKLKVYTSTGWQFYDATAQTASQNAALSASQAASSAATSQSYATTAINKAAEAATSANAADASADAALASENAAESSEINASASENYALNYKNAAATSADLASSYASASGVSATNAATSAATATTQATNSANSATASATSATNSANSALASANSATNAANSAASAATSAANAGVSEANADTSEANALASANTATTKAAEASTSATNAATSATNSAASATSSALSEGLATTAAATATTKASEASVSATSASGSATTATTKAAEATTAATSANTSATNAATSATNAANSASSATTSSASASTSATLAGNSANAAALSETNAATSASAANTYASNAATSASSADTSESNAEIYADNALASSIAAANTVTTVTGYANTASTKADEASASATSAANSATSATASANTASTQATNASNSATAASTSASNASTSATTASTQASNAAASASSASTSASAANISAINANTSATSAANSATAAGSAKLAAEAARDQALAAFDNFDDKYLGEKASNPTLDNDGNTLVVGALYFNTTLQGMRVYTGTAWVAAYMSGDGYLLASNNLSELTNVVTARSNLGLGTSALANGYNLDGLTDVTITSATNGQILEYESATSTWKNKTINALPTQATHNGQFLTTDGTNASWATVDALPPQATHADKFLRTDGTAAYWATVNLPTSAYTRTSFTATAGQTTFNVTYPLGSIQVYVNGVLLKTSDYTATNETSFTLTVPASAGAAVDALVYNVYGVGQVLAENIIGTVDIESGGTGATTAAGARTNLGLGTAATTDSTAYATAAQGALIDNIVSATKEPIGFVNKNDSSISFNSTTRVFTISPVGGSFEVWCKGVKNVVSTAQTITLPNTTALYYIYYSSLGVLSYKTTYFTWDTDTPVSYVYWNATTGQATYFADERHGTTLDWATHEYLHRTRGAVIASGFAANGYTLSGTGDLNSDAQISIESGTFFDEDLEINVVSTATPTQNTWTQNLLFPAKIPVLRLSGASEWILDTATDYPLKQGTARPQYNYYSGGVWLTADVLNNDYTCSWIIATNNLNHPVMAIISQSNLTTLSNAQSAKFEELILTNFPSLEFRPLYKLIFQGNDGYDNTPNARLREIYDLRAVQSAGVSAAAVNDHSNLSGLSDDDHPQYLHVDNVRTVSAAVKASLLPSQTTNANKFLNTNGTETSWSLVDVGNVTGALPIINGGTGATTASGALTNLGAYPATNPSSYITTAGARSAISVTGAGSYDSGTGVINIVGGVTSFNTRTGAISLTSGDVTGALGFTPYNSTNPNGYISGITSGNVTTALGYSPENVANKGNANGYASLDGSGLVPASQLPSYVDDVLEYTNLASFPGAGTTGKIYVALDTNKTYRWSGTTYIYITSGAVDSVAGKTGVVTLNNSDVGLGSVENKSSATIRGEITSSNVTTALGFTPYNATNPSGYITSSALSSYLPLSGGTLTGPVLTTTDSSSWGVYSRTSGYENYSGIWFSTNVGELLLRKADGSLSTRIAADGSFAFINNNNILHAGNYNSYALPLSGGTMSGDLTATRIRGVNSLVLNTYTTVNPASNVYLYSPLGDRDAWIYLDSADTGSNWGIYHRQIDSAVSGLPANSLGFIGGGTSALQAWISLANGSANFAGALTQAGNQVLHASNYSSYALPLSGGTVAGPVTITGNDNQLIIDATSGPTAGIFLRHSGVNKWEIYNSSNAFGLYNYSSGQNELSISAATGIANFRNTPTAGGNAILHASNYNSYAPTLTGGGASGTWGISVSGNASSSLQLSSDTSSKGSALQYWQIYDRPDINPNSNWHYALRMSHGDAETYYSGTIALDFGSDILSFRRKVNGTNQSWRTILHDGNYNSYAPSLTGGNASGTWGINITGNAGGSSTSVSTSSSTGIQSSHVAGINTTTPGLATYGIAFSGSSSTDNAQGITWGWSGTNAQAGIYVQSSGSYGTKMYFGTTDSFATGSKTSMSIDHVGNVNLPRGTFSNGSVWINNGTNSGNYNENIRLFNAPNGASVIAFSASGTSGTPTTSLLGYSDRFEIRYADAWQQRTYNGYVEALGSFRAPIFYDSNDTGYYTDPRSTSNLFDLTITGSSHKYLFINPGNGYEAMVRYNGGSGNSWYVGKRTANVIVGSADFHFYSEAVSASVCGIDTSGNVFASGSSRAPIFYDSNNTAYYLDPSSTGTSMNAAGNVTIGNSGANTGLFINYGGGAGDYAVVGRCYQAGTNNQTIHVFSTAWQSGTLQSTSAGSINLDGANGTTIGAWNNNDMWIDKSGNSQSRTSSRAPIFYDSNDTAYYCDPNSVSRLYVVRANGLQFGGSDAYMFDTGLWAGTGGYPGYQFTGGNSRFGFSSTSGYIDVYTDGNFYGGIDLYGANRLVPLFDANQGGGALYSSIIYDSNSTGFYLDPSSAGKSMIVNGNIELTARSESWGEGIRINVPTAGTWGGIRWNRSGASGPGNWALGYTGINSTDDLTFWSGTQNLIMLNLDHSGNLIARGNITAYGSPSDRRLKENIQPITGALNKVLQLQGCTFTWKEDSREHEYVGLSEDIGFIADEVQEILPAMVRKGDDGYLSLRDRGFSALLVEALKEQNQEVVDLKSKLNQQQLELDELKSLVKSLLANR